MEFEWHVAKAAGNLAKHGVSFEEACSVFGDWGTLTTIDTDHSVGETRYVTLGRSSAGRVLVVVHTESEERIRVISARRASRAEGRRYEEGRNP